MNSIRQTRNPQLLRLAGDRISGYTESNPSGGFRISVLCLFALVLSCGLSYSGTIIELDLTGRIQSEGGTPSLHGFGAYGLYLGEDFDSGLTGQYTNWNWDALRMAIFDNGDANISGTITRHDSSVWTMNIDLFGLELKGDVFNGQSTAYEDMVADLLASEEHGAGLEWNSLSMGLTAPYTTSVPLTGWTGLAMPNPVEYGEGAGSGSGSGSGGGHDNVAELHFDTGRGLSFEAWYENSLNSGSYQVGDTKANAFLLPGTPDSPVPEPSVWALITLGALAIILRKKRGLGTAKSQA